MRDAWMRDAADDGRLKTHGGELCILPAVIICSTDHFHPQATCRYRAPFSATSCAQPCQNPWSLGTRWHRQNPLPSCSQQRSHSFLLTAWQTQPGVFAQALHHLPCVQSSAIRLYNLGPSSTSPVSPALELTIEPSQCFQYILLTSPLSFYFLPYSL